VCFNVAVAAHAALEHPDIQRVLIVDWGVSQAGYRCLLECGRVGGREGREGQEEGRRGMEHVAACWGQRMRHSSTPTYSAC
jgi:hypothetical protein